MWRTMVIRLCVAGYLTMSLVLAATSVQAKSTPEAVLTCGGDQYVVSGFGRGEVLHVSDSTSNFVVTYARSGSNVLIDIRGQQNKQDIVTCSVTSPLSGTEYTFRGFFTPRNESHEPEL